MVNRMESIVIQAVEELLSCKRDLCSCDRCKYDIIALALNMLPPRYVVTTLGEVVTSVNLQSPQWKADIMMAVYKAIEIVQKNPRHTPSPKPTDR